MLGYAFTWLASPALFGSWKVNVVTGGLPQKVATAFGNLNETMVGASYEPIALLGQQVANGTNYAVLAKQTLVTKDPQTNIVILKFNEKEMDCTLYAIETVLEGNNLFGGLSIDPKVGKEIDPDSLAAFEAVTNGWVGTDIKPVALLASKVVKGVDLTWLCVVTPVYPGAAPTVKLVTTNSVAHTIDFADVL